MAILSPESPGILENGISAAGGSSKVFNIFIMGFVVLVVLVGMGWAAKRWLYPFAINDLEREIGVIWELIEENTRRHWDLLGGSGWEFKRRLYEKCGEMADIKNRSTVEPDRWNLRAWVVLQWREMNDVKKCYLTLMTLKKEIT
ncbi:hypothetical protein AAF712_008581, partial [Marasmius tenuissimus]